MVDANISKTKQKVTPKQNQINKAQGRIEEEIEKVQKNIKNVDESNGKGTKHIYDKNIKKTNLENKIKKKDIVQDIKKLICPSCNKEFKVKIPNLRAKQIFTTCPSCKNRFNINKENYKTIYEQIRIPKNQKLENIEYENDLLKNNTHKADSKDIKNNQEKNDSQNIYQKNIDTEVNISKPVDVLQAEKSNIKNQNNKKTDENKNQLLLKISKSFGNIFKKMSKKNYNSSNKIENNNAEKEEEESTEDITIIPEVTNENIDIIETISINEPYSYVQILYDNDIHEYLYKVIEPQMSEEERGSLEFIEVTLLQTLEYELEEVEDIKNLLKEKVDKIIFNYNLDINDVSKERILYYIYRNFTGYGKINIIMDDKNIEDISCDGPGIPIFLYHRKYDSIKTNIIFENDAELDSYVIRLVQRCGKHISVANPIVDATIPDGSRLQVCLSHEVTPKGSTFTIRKFKEDPLTPPDLVKYNTLSAEVTAFLWLAVQYGQSMICSGGTASGKTTTLNAVALFIPPQMKIVSIEDTKELNLPHENWIAGLTREGFGVKTKEGGAIGEIDMYELMRAALRQRPQYMIVGEVRGKETYTLFQAMSTGHTTYSTMHADSAQSIVHRLESPPINLPRILLSALNIIILQGQVRLGENMVRRVKEIIEIVGIEENTNEILTNTVFKWSPANDSFRFFGHSALFDKIGMIKNISLKDVLDEWKSRIDIIKWMTQKGVRSYLDVSKKIAEYYKEPEKTIEKVRYELYKEEKVTHIRENELENIVDNVIQETKIIANKVKEAESLEAIGKKVNENDEIENPRFPIEIENEVQEQYKTIDPGTLNVGENNSKNENLKDMRDSILLGSELDEIDKFGDKRNPGIIGNEFEEIDNLNELENVSTFETELNEIDNLNEVGNLGTFENDFDEIDELKSLETLNIFGNELDKDDNKKVEGTKESIRGG